MLDEEFKNLSRSAIVIRGKQPFKDWLVEHDPEMKLDEEILQGSIYLLPDYDSVSQVQNWLKKNFKEIFDEELYNWYTDEDMWPQKRNFKMFGEWFDYSLHTMIFDTQKGFIEKF